MFITPTFSTNCRQKAASSPWTASLRHGLWPRLHLLRCNSPSTSFHHNRLLVLLHNCSSNLVREGILPAHPHPFQSQRAPHLGSLRDRRLSRVRWSHGHRMRRLKMAGSGTLRLSPKSVMLGSTSRFEPGRTSLLSTNT